jgi:hypothetical protein
LYIAIPNMIKSMDDGKLGSFSFDLKGNKNRYKQISEG